MKAVVVLPTYNERENIAQLIPHLFKDVFPHVKDHTMEVLVVDDESPDGTGEVVKDLMKKYSKVKIITGKKEGLGKAYLRGMSYAIDTMKADVVFEMDSDGQHDAAKIPDFMKKIDEGYDMVIGTRYSDGGSIPSNWPFMRKLYSIIANLFIRVVFTRFAIHDWTGGYRALKKEVFLKEKEALKNFNGYIFQISFLHMAERDGFSIAEVPFHFKDRTLGKSKIPTVGYIVDVVTYVVKTRFIELMTGKFGKFLVVGGFGFILNAIMLRILVEGFGWLPYLANLAGGAVAIFSNYNFNNLWTFKHTKANSVSSYFIKMGQFYLTSAFGVIVIQTGTIYVGTHFITNNNHYFFYFLLGTGFLVFWNFFIYSKVIWRKKKEF